MRRKVMHILAIIALLSVFTAGCEYKTNPSSAILHHLVDSNNLRITTEYLVNTIGIRVAGSKEESETLDYLVARLEEMGFSEEDSTLYRTDFYSVSNLHSENVVAICNKGKSDEILVILAHVDSVETSPGAKDNAAAVAATLEMARILSTSAEHIDYEVRMIFAGAEETGYYGSTAYVKSLSETERRNHLGAFSMDIAVGSYDEGSVFNCNTLGGRSNGEYVRGNWLVPVDNLVSISVIAALQEIMGYTDEDNGVLYSSPYNNGYSDHVSFHNAQIDSANIGWRRLRDGAPTMPQEYHRMTDTTENLDFETTKLTAQCILRAIELLSENKSYVLANYLLN